MIPGDGFPIAACRQEEEGKWGGCAGAVIDGSIPRNSHVLNLDKQKQREKIVLSF